MSDDVLSRNDVESLLRSLDNGASTTEAAAPAQKTDAKKPASKVRVLAYDF